MSIVELKCILLMCGIFLGVNVMMLCVVVNLRRSFSRFLLSLRSRVFWSSRL